MKTFAFILLFITSSLCSADYKCALSTEDITLVTPTSQDIVNTFWQDDKDEYETIKRLYVTYTDGSLAIIEHKLCAMYNFEVAYYTKNQDTLSSTEAIQKQMNLLFSYSANQNAPLNEAIASITKKLNEKDFNTENAITASFYGANEKLQKAEYKLSYLPIEDSSLNEAALFLYMGIGGMH